MLTIINNLKIVKKNWLVISSILLPLNLISLWIWLVSKWIIKLFVLKHNSWSAQRMARSDKMFEIIDTFYLFSWFTFD